MPAKNEKNVDGREGRNHHESANHRVLFQLTGTKSNKAAIGARATVIAGTLTRFDEMRGGASYTSQKDLLDALWAGGDWKDAGSYDSPAERPN